MNCVLNCTNIGNVSPNVSVLHMASVSSRPVLTFHIQPGMRQCVIMCQAMCSLSAWGGAQLLMLSSEWLHAHYLLQCDAIMISIKEV